MAFQNPYATPSASAAAPEAPTAPSGFTNPYAVGSGADVDTGGGISIGGFVGNVLGGIKDIVGGAVSLLGAGVHDVGKIAAEAIPGEQQIERQGFSLDNVGMTLAGFSPSGEWDPAHYGISGDIWRRYSPLLPGGPAASETLRMLYDEPVSFALDALAVASFGATAGAGAAGNAIKGTAAASRAAEVTEALKLAGFGGKAALRAGYRAGLDMVAEGRALTAVETLSRATLPTVKYIRVGEQLAPTITAVNPALRPLAAGYRRVTTEPVSALRARVESLGADIDGYLQARGIDPATAGDVMVQSKQLTQLAADYRLAKSLLDEAEATGTARLAKDFWSNKAVSHVARKLSGELNGQFLLARQNRQNMVISTLRPWLQNNPEIASKAAGLWQRLDIDLAGESPAHWAGRNLEMESLDSRLVHMVDGGPHPDLQLALDPAVRAGVSPNLLARTDEVVKALEETRAKWTADAERLGALGYDVADEVDSINRMIDHLHDAVNRRFQAQNPEALAAGAGVDPALLAMDDVRLLNLKQSMALWKDPGGALSPRMMLDRAYMPLRAKYGAKLDIDGSWVDGPDTKALDDALRASGEAAPIYFPHMDPAEVGAWEFFRSKKPVGGSRLAADPNLKRNQAKLLERGSYITDPMEAYSRRAARAVRSEETYRTLMTFATRLGRPISRADEIGSNEVLFAPELARVMKRTEMRVQDITDDLTSHGVSREEAVAKAVKEVTEQNQDELADMLKQAEDTGREVQMYAVPRAAAERLEDAARYAQGWGPKGVRTFYDSAMQAWRQLTLFTRPAYVANQFLGNTAFAILHGSGLRQPMSILARRAGEAIMARLGRSVDDQVLNRLDDLPGFDELGHGLFGSLPDTYVPRNPALAATALGRASRRLGETKAGMWGKRWMEAERKAAVEIDNAFRASGYVTAAERAAGVTGVRRVFRSFRSLNTRIDKLLEGGFGDDITRVNDALREAKMFFGDYSAMGAFERHVIRRYLFPWWGFTRHNIQLMLKFPIEMPLRAEIMQSLQNVDEEYRKQYGAMPPWLDTSVPMGPPGSEVPFFSLRGGSPFEGVFAPPTSQLAPLPKMALERIMGRNLFTDQPFTDKDVITPFGSDQPYRIIRDQYGNVTSVEPVEGKVLPGVLEHFLRQFPPYSYLERAVAGDASTYGTATLTDLARGQGIMYDENGQPIDQEGLASVLGSLAGVPINQVDLAAYQEQLSAEEKAALTAALKRFQP